MVGDQLTRRLNKIKNSRLSFVEEYELATFNILSRFYYFILLIY